MSIRRAQGVHNTERVMEQVFGKKAQRCIQYRESIWKEGTKVYTIQKE